MLSWFRANPKIDVATQRYVDIVTAARNPMLFKDFGVPDSLDGRFEAIVLHCWLVMRRLKRIDAARDLSQRLFDILFQDMDQNLREMGVSDIVVGDRVKTMAKAFYGRVAAYETGLEEGEASFQQAIERNVFGTTAPDAAAMNDLCAYLRRADAALQALNDQRMLSPEPLSWPSLPAHA